MAHILALFAYVVPGRVELPTSTLSVWRSNQPSYRTVSQINRANGDLHRNFMEHILTHLPIALPIYIVTSQHEIQVVKLLTNLFKTFVKTRFLFNKPNYIAFHSDTCFGSRKEVFQPHLPVRLPCYDLAPITGFTLGRSLRLRTSGTPGFHGLTGGVYKARERIHRAMADARLLANPASWRRVADSSPN